MKAFKIFRKSGQILFHIHSNLILLSFQTLFRGWRQPRSQPVLQLDDLLEDVVLRRQRRRLRRSRRVADADDASGRHVRRGRRQEDELGRDADVECRRDVGRRRRERKRRRMLLEAVLVNASEAW